MTKRSISKTTKEYGRGIVGGLLFSLSLLYTMEVWWTGFIASPEKLLAFVGFTFLLLLGYNRHVGMRRDASFKDLLLESVEEIGLAFIIAFFFLLLINKVSFTMSFSEIAGKVIVESMIVAIGVSVGTTQLGQESDSNKNTTKEEGIIQLLILGICGGALVSSSVAPTEEILKIAIISDSLHLLAMIMVSFLISAVVLFFSNFIGASPIEGIQKMIILLIINYLCAMIVSFVMLWFFNRIDGYGWNLIIAEIIVLAIPASLGASAGRLLIG